MKTKCYCIMAILVVFANLPAQLCAQVISTFAGIGPSTTYVGTFSGDGGPATAAGLSHPCSVCLDRVGNVYISDLYNYRIRRVDTLGIIATIAGNGSLSDSFGLPATTTGILPSYIRIDRYGNIFSSSTSYIYKIDTLGFVSLFAGQLDSSGYSGDGGPATAALLYTGGCFALDDTGNLYFGNSTLTACGIRKIDTNGIITTITGINPCGDTGDGGTVTTALIEPKAIAVDRKGNIYLGDNSAVIRKIDTAGIITAFAGTGISGYSGDGGAATLAQIYVPNGIVTDSLGNLYIADVYNMRVRKVDTSGFITTVAGNGIYGFSGDDGPADSAELAQPNDMAISSNGDIFIADSRNNRIRKVHYIPEGVQAPTAAAAGIGLYPNPCSRAGFTISFPPGAAQDAVVSITTLTGAVVQQLAAPTTQPLHLPLPAPPGLYLVRITTRAGSWVQKVVVE